MPVAVVNVSFNVRSHCGYCIVEVALFSSPHL